MVALKYVGITILALALASGAMLAVAVFITSLPKLGKFISRNIMCLTIIQLLAVLVLLFGVFILFQAFDSDLWLSDQLVYGVGGAATILGSAAAVYGLQSIKKSRRAARDRASSAKCRAKQLEQQMAAGTASDDDRLELAGLYLVPGVDKHEAATAILREAETKGMAPQYYVDLSIAEAMQANEGAAWRAMNKCRDSVPSEYHDLLDAYIGNRIREIVPTTFWTPLKEWWEKQEEYM